LATGAYERLLAWSVKTGNNLSVSKGVTANKGLQWSIHVAIVKPVAFTASASSSTIDEAANKIIEDLQTVRETVS
jgi:hypothetical protein